MSTKSIVRFTWFLILAGLIVRAAAFALTQTYDVWVGFYLLGPYVALAVAFYWLQKDRKPAIVMFIGALVVVLITIVSFLSVWYGDAAGWWVFGIPPAQLIVAVLFILVAVLLKLFGRD